METPNRIAAQIFGHNRAPLDEVLAKDFAELAAEVERAVKVVTSTPAKIKDEADFAATGTLANRVKSLAKRIEETRKDETDPLFKAQKEIKAHFDALADQLDRALKPHLAAADDYTRAKAAEERRRREDEARKLREKEEAERRKADETTNDNTAARAEGRAEALGAKAEKLESGQGSAADAVRTKTAGGGVATARTVWDFSVANYNDLDLNELRSFIPQAEIDKAIRSVVRIQKGNTTLKGVSVFEDTKATFRS